MKTKSTIIPAILLSLFFLGSAFNKAPGSEELTGAGATFPYPLYSKMFSQYNGKTGVKVNYQSIGSGGGIKQLFSKTVDFGASDAYLSDKELSEAGSAVVHIPTCLGAVCVAYNIPGVSNLNLDPATLGGIFSGSITKWNDPKIQSINKGAKLPAKDIMVAHRSDGSGTTFIFTNYLCLVSSEFKGKVGSPGKTVNWPVGIGGKGNEGVAGQIKTMEGSIGYVELVYAKNNNITAANIKNSSGKFISASLESTSASAKDNIPADTRVDLVNSSSANAYPITSFTWLLLYKEQNYGGRSKAQAKAMVDLMWWMIHDGQSNNEPLFYGKLPAKAIKAAEANLKSITYDGKPLL